MQRQKWRDEHLAPEDIDLVVLMTVHMDGDLLKRAVKKALGNHVEIRGGAISDAMFAADGAAGAAWKRLESWQQMQSFRKYQYEEYEEDAEHSEL